MIQATILIIDDDQDVLNLCQSIFEANGHTVICSSNGKAGLDYLVSHSPPDLIILDLTMPVMNGREFRKAQLAEPRLKDILVILFSSEPYLKNLAKSLGCQHFVQKSFDKLVEKVNEVLSSILK